MAARHFARGVPSFEEENNEVEEDLLDVPNMGKHAKRPVLEYVSAPVSSFAVEVPADADADAQARAYIEGIMRELEASLARPKPPIEPEPPVVPELPLVPEPPVVPVPPVVPSVHESPEVYALNVEAGHGDMSESAPVTEHDASSGVKEPPAIESLPELEPAEPADAGASAEPAESVELDTTQSHAFWSNAEPSDIARVPAVATQTVEGAAEAASEGNSDDEMESTAVLDHEAIRQAVQDQEESSEEIVQVQRPERLEVDSGFYVPPNNSTSEIGTGLAKRKPRLSFFARIGETIARLFHMDD